MITLQENIKNHITNVSNFPKEGIEYKDITAVFLNPALCDQIIATFCAFSRGKIDVVCGIESRGFLFGIQIARELQVPFILIRKAGKLPPPTLLETYQLEYGSASIEVQNKYFKPNQRVLIHDDVLATGGTAEASAKLIQKCGAKVTQFSFLVDLTFLNGKEKLLNHSKDIQTLVEY